MSAVWLLYIVGVSALLALAARAAESVALLYGRVTRWVWVTALSATLLVPFAGFVIQRVRAPLSAPAVPLVSEDVSAKTVPTGVFVPQRATTPDPAPGRFDLPRAALPVKVPASAMTTRDSLAFGWGVFSLGALLFLIGAHARLARARRRWSSGRLCDAEVLVSRDAGPAALGILRPVIVVPEWLLSSDDVVQRMVVRHEREHLRTRDPLLLACGTLAVALMPWNPVSWWLLFRLRSAVEVDCDRRVLSGGTNARAYGSMLLRVAGRSSRLSFAAALIEPPSLLERRIRVMSQGLVRLRGLRAVALGIVALVTAGFAVRAEAPFVQQFELRTRELFGEEFEWVSSVRELSDGTVIVQESKDGPVKILVPGTGLVEVVDPTRADSDGEIWLSGLYPLRADSTLLVDSHNHDRRFLFFERERWTDRVDDWSDPSISSTTGPIGYDTIRGGWILRNLTTTARLPEPGRNYRAVRSDLIIRTSRDFASRDTVATIGGGASVGWTEDGVPHVASVAPSDEALGFPDGWIALAFQDPYHVEWITPDGDRIRGPDLIREPTAPGRMAMTIQPYKSLINAPDGRVLVRRASSQGSPTTRYDVVDRAGQLNGFFLLDGNEHVVGSGTESLYIVSEDSAGARHLRRVGWPRIPGTGGL